MSTKRPNPTMNDVARVAGVSLKTVSRFVNGETNIDPTLAEKIASAIQLLGYRRNLAAASIRPGWTSKMVGLVISDLANPYYSTLARAIEDELASQGYMLIVSSSSELGKRHDQILDRLMAQRVDGLIIVPPRHTDRTWAMVAPPIPPVVFLDRPGDLEAADTVLADNAGGAAAATKALFEAGARKIVFLGDSLEIYTMSQRYQGYTAALTTAGLDPSALTPVTSAHSREDARHSAVSLISGGQADAIFAANNRAAIGALEAFQDMGTSIPIIGFDDFEAAHLIGSGVSTVSQDIDKMGRDAALILLDRLRGDKGPFQVRTSTTRLILRGSELAEGSAAR